jgi:hypothetical protein
MQLLLQACLGLLLLQLLQVQVAMQVVVHPCRRP